MIAFQFPIASAIALAIVTIPLVIDWAIFGRRRSIFISIFLIEAPLLVALPLWSGSSGGGLYDNGLFAGLASALLLIPSACAIYILGLALGGVVFRFRQGW